MKPNTFNGIWRRSGHGTQNCSLEIVRYVNSNPTTSSVGTIATVQRIGTNAYDIVGDDTMKPGFGASKQVRMKSSTGSTSIFNF